MWDEFRITWATHLFFDFLFFFFGGERKEDLIKSQQSAKKYYDVLCKRPFSHIMPKACKTLGTTLFLNPTK